MKEIGQLNGKWSVLFRVLLSLNAILLPLALTWTSWVSVQVINLKWELKATTQDRFSGGMFIEVQDYLQSHNPELRWLTAAEIRKIQQSNPPYRR